MQLEYCLEITMLRHGLKFLKDTLRWEKRKLSLLGRIYVIKMKVLPRMTFMFQIIPILTMDTPFKQWQKDISKFVRQVEKAQVELQLMQDAKTSSGLGLPDLRVNFATFCLELLKGWVTLRNKRLWN